MKKISIIGMGYVGLPLAVAFQKYYEVVGFDLKKLGSFNLDTVNASGYSFFMKTIFEISKRKIEIKEIPITFKDRSQGYSKLPRIEIFRTLLNLFLLIFKK